MAKNMRINVSVADDGMETPFLYRKGQKVNFINILNSAKPTKTPPKEMSYKIEGTTDFEFAALLNYIDYSEQGSDRRFEPSQGFAPIYESGHQTIDLFRREVKTMMSEVTNYEKLVQTERQKIINLEEAKKVNAEYRKKDQSLCFRLIGGTTYISIEEYDEKMYGKFTEFYPVLYIKITPKDKKGNRLKEEVVETPLTTLELVGEGINTFTFRDFNISNGRTYQYILYPVIGGDRLVREEVIVHTGWQAWSITELHPVDNSGKKFYAGSDDVWLFNLNLESGAQAQNLSRNEQQTLGTFPRYSQGRKNYVSGDISCLLGSEVIPASYAKKKMSESGQTGYVERLLFNLNPTSNEKVDMLKAWRKVVYSNNPKLLKDRAGQSFLITITQSSNKPYDNIVRQPNTLNFSWTQIGDSSKISVLDMK